MAPSGELNDLSFPYPYVVRKSRRAKHINIKISRDNGLELVVPTRVAKRDALEFLYERIDWIEKHAVHLKSQVFDPPFEINLQCLQRAVGVTYDFCDKVRAKIVSIDEYEICYVGKQNQELIQAKLIAWTKKQIKEFLLERLHAISQQTGVDYSQATCRDQKTLWGSCNHKKAISLNYRLAFIPPAVVDYVIVHELCHTIHMNHSKKFWCLVESFMADYKQKEKALKLAQKCVPDWYLG